jgi:hypothetical protein
MVAAVFLSGKRQGLVQGVRNAQGTGTHRRCKAVSHLHGKSMQANTRGLKNAVRDLEHDVWHWHTPWTRSSRPPMC